MGWGVNWRVDMVHPEALRAALCDASGLRLAGIEPERGRIDAGLVSFY